MSEREPELGLGVVASVDPAAKRIAIDFPATKERRLYALGTGVLKRVQFRVGDAVATREGAEDFLWTLILLPDFQLIR